VFSTGPDNLAGHQTEIDQYLPPDQEICQQAILNFVMVVPSGHAIIATIFSTIKAVVFHQVKGK
jgi:hypothetical protein